MYVPCIIIHTYYGRGVTENRSAAECSAHPVHKHLLHRSSLQHSAACEVLYNFENLLAWAH